MNPIQKKFWWHFVDEDASGLTVHSTGDFFAGVTKF